MSKRHMFGAMPQWLSVPENDFPIVITEEVSEIPLILCVISSLAFKKNGAIVQE